MRNYFHSAQIQEAQEESKVITTQMEEQKAKSIILHVKWSAVCFTIHHIPNPESPIMPQFWVVQAGATTFISMLEHPRA